MMARPRDRRSPRPAFREVLFPRPDVAALSWLILAAALVTEASANYQLPDARVFVGQLFVYKIPSTLFPDADSLQVIEASHGGLPKWLYYSSHSRSLAGIPSSDDTGVYIIAVQPSDGSTSELFAISVTADDWMEYTKQHSIPTQGSQTVGDSVSRASCAHGGQYMTASIVIDVNMVDLSARDRVRLVRTVADQLGLRHTDVSSSSGWPVQLDELRLTAAKGSELTFRKARQSPESLIVAGPGNVPSGRWLPGVIVSWPVGCKSISESSLAVIESLEVAAKDGTLAQALSFDIIGWSITNVQFSTGETVEGRRLRRQSIQATATPVPEQPPPSAGATPEDVTRSVPQVVATASFHAHPTGAEVEIRPTAVVTAVAASAATEPRTLLFITPPPPPPPPPYPVTGFKHASSTTKPPADPPSTAASSPTAGVERPPTVTAAAQMAASTTPANLPPQVTEAIPEQTIFVGQLQTFGVPEDTFYDEEDATTTSGLSVRVLTSAGSPLPPNGWITFDPLQLTFTMLPDKEAVGRHVFAVEARDRGGATARTRLAVNVLPASEATANAAQVYTLTIDISYDEFMASRQDSMARLMAALESMHGGRRIVITDVRPGSVIVSYVMLPPEDDGSPVASGSDCDELNARLDNSRMFNADGTVRQDVLRAMPFPVLSLQATPSGPCSGKLPVVGGSASVTTTATTVAAAAEVPSARTPAPSTATFAWTAGPVTATVNLAPKATVSVLDVKVDMGKEFLHEIPSDLFADEDGDVRSLDVSLVRDVGSHQEPVARHSSWVRLMKTSHRAPAGAAADAHAAGSGKALHGLLWRNADAKATYLLRAADSGGREAAVRVQFHVSRESVRAISATVAKLRLVLSQPPPKAAASAVGDLAVSVDEQLRLLGRIAAAYGDDVGVRAGGVNGVVSAHLALLDVAVDGLNVSVTWTNTSVTASIATGGGGDERCPSDVVAALAAPIVDRADGGGGGGGGGSGRIGRAFADSLRPLTVIAFEMQPVRACARAGMPPLYATHEGEGRRGSAHDDARHVDSMVGIVAPVAVIVALLLIAIVVAAILVARRRQRRARVARTGEDGGVANAAAAAGTTTIGKGVPVIFDEELDENAACRQPLVAHDESKAVPPPAYPGEGPAEAAAIASGESDCSASDGDAPSPDAEQSEPLLGAKSAGGDSAPAGQEGIAKTGAGDDAVPPYAPPPPPPGGDQAGGSPAAATTQTAAEGGQS